MVVGRRVLLGLGVVFLLISVLAGYTQAVLVSDSGFVDHAAATLDHADVRAALSTALVTRLLKNAPPKAQRAEPVLEEAVNTVIGSRMFRELFRRTLLRSHHAILSGNGHRIMFNLSAESRIILDVLARRDPQLAGELRPARSKLVQVSGSSPLLPLLRLVHALRGITIVAPMLTALCLWVSIALGKNRRRALRNAGIAVAATAASVWLCLVLVEVAGSWLLNGTLAQAFPGLFESLFGDLRRWALAITLAGIALIAIANSSRRPMEFSTLWSRIRDWTPSGSGMGRTALTGLAVGTTGLLLVFQPLAVPRLLVIVLGASAVYFGTGIALGSVYLPTAIHPARTVTIPDERVGAARWCAVALVTSLLVLLWARDILTT